MRHPARAVSSGVSFDQHFIRQNLMVEILDLIWRFCLFTHRESCIHPSAFTFCRLGQRADHPHRLGALECLPGPAFSSDGDGLGIRDGSVGDDDGF